MFACKICGPKRAFWRLEALVSFRLMCCLGKCGFLDELDGISRGMIGAGFFLFFLWKLKEGGQSYELELRNISKSRQNTERWCWFSIGIGLAVYNLFQAMDA